MTSDPIIIALDFKDAQQARALIARLGGAVNFYKVGLELYAAEGMPFVRDLIADGKQVFLDLKLYDIGETVKRAVAQVAPTGVRFLTVHASSALMRAAVEGRADSALKLLGVTVLTSFDQRDLADLGHSPDVSVSSLVGMRAKNAVTAGMDGVVCSPLEAAAVRQVVGPQTIIVTPGVRSRTADAGDQKRTATPAEALAAGANYMVIGRQVTRAGDPQAELKRILAEIACTV